MCAPTSPQLKEYCNKSSKRTKSFGIDEIGHHKVQNNAHSSFYLHSLHAACRSSGDFLGSKCEFSLSLHRFEEAAYFTLLRQKDIKMMPLRLSIPPLDIHCSTPLSLHEELDIGYLWIAEGYKARIIHLHVRAHFSTNYQRSAVVHKSQAPCLLFLLEL